MTRVGIIGTGGFAGSHHNAVRALEAAGECRLVCTCDPNAVLLADARTRFDLDGRGVETFEDYRSMLDSHRNDLDVVTVPTPLPLHAEMHRACVEGGFACYLEKPPTLDPDEMERMLAVEANAARQTQVAFNFIVEEPRRALKARLAAGEFGRVRRVTFVGLWPRADTYFTRSGWAGRLLWHDGRLVLDSVIGNALAHHVHNTLFWAGTDALSSWASPAAVWADIYRAHAIEGLDTCFVRAECDNGVEVRLAATHACDGAQEQREQVECDDAVLTYVTGGSYQVTWKDGRPPEDAPADRRVLLQENLRAYFAYVRGEAERPLTRLIDSRPFVHFNALVYVAAGAITPVGPTHVHRSPAANGDLIAIAGVRDACRTFVETGDLPAAQGLPWARQRDRDEAPARPGDLPRLPEIIGGMAGGGAAAQAQA